MRALVSGGAGFIGSHLVRSLLGRGLTVRVLDNLATGKVENLEGLRGDIDLVAADIRDPTACHAACADVEAVFHLAALGSVSRSVEDPVTSHEVNVNGTLNMLLAARQARVRRFVYASSSSVYGDAEEPLKSERLPPRPLSPYAVSKLAGEAYAAVFHRVYGLETVALRYFNVFGPRQDPDSLYAAVIPRFASSLLRLKPPPIFGDGNQTRDFTFVDNVVRANLLALECAGEACGRAYNIAGGKSTSVNDLFALIRSCVGGASLKINPRYEPARKGDVRTSLASLDLAREALGYVPGIGIADGIQQSVAWYRGRGGDALVTSLERPSCSV